MVSCLLSGLIVDLAFFFEHLFVEVFIMIIPNKGFLYVFLIKQLHVLKNLLAVLIFPFAVCVGRIEVVLVRRGERTLDALVQEVVPGEVSEPRVVFDVFGPVETETVERLSLNETVDEISGFDTPAGRDLRSLDLNLFGKNMLSYLPSISSSVWSSSKHAFISDNAHCKVIHGNAMRLFAHNFGGHVTWSS
jgi:hypothetical protein